MALGPHAFFIVASYAVTAAVILGLVLHAVLDHRAQLRILAELEARGATRRSAAGELSDFSRRDGADVKAARAVRIENSP